MNIDYLWLTVITILILVGGRIRIRVRIGWEKNERVLAREEQAAADLSAAGWTDHEIAELLAGGHCHTAKTRNICNQFNR
jgi:hypothetical protein